MRRTGRHAGRLPSEVIAYIASLVADRHQARFSLVLTGVLAIGLAHMPIVVLLLITVVAYILFNRSREIFVLRLRSGKLRRVRGKVPPGLLSSFREVLGDAQNGTVKASRTPHGARLSTTGVSSVVEQRMRNILGLYPASKLSAPSVDKRRAAHDVMTIAWFLSFFRR